MVKRWNLLWGHGNEIIRTPPVEQERLAAAAQWAYDMQCAHVRTAEEFIEIIPRFTALRFHNNLLRFMRRGAAHCLGHHAIAFSQKSIGNQNPLQTHSLGRAFV